MTLPLHGTTAAQGSVAGLAAGTGKGHVTPGEKKRKKKKKRTSHGKQLGKGACQLHSSRRRRRRKNWLRKKEKEREREELGGAC